MFSVPEGRAANQPLVAVTFSPPMAALFPGARVSFAVIGSPASVASLTASGESFSSLAFSSGVDAASISRIKRRAKFSSHLAIVLAGIWTTGRARGWGWKKVFVR